MSGLKLSWATRVEKHKAGDMSKQWRSLLVASVILPPYDASTA
jgi:hypothetical protein